jgi:hypothetical protein
MTQGIRVDHDYAKIITALGAGSRDVSSYNAADISPGQAIDASDGFPLVKPTTSAFPMNPFHFQPPYFSRL